MKRNEREAKIPDLRAAVHWKVAERAGLEGMALYGDGCGLAEECVAGRLLPWVPGRSLWWEGVAAVRR